MTDFGPGLLSHHYAIFCSEQMKCSHPISGLSNCFVVGSKGQQNHQLILRELNMPRLQCFKFAKECPFIFTDHVIQLFVVL